MVEIMGSADDRKYAADVADWCARELATARQTGSLETRPFVQNADLIIAALREYARGRYDGVRSPLDDLRIVKEKWWPLTSYTAFEPG